MKWDLDSHTSSRSLTHPAGNLNNKPAARNDHTAQPETEPALNRFALKPLALGAVRADDAAAYAEYVQRTGIEGYRGTPGNRGAWLLWRADGDRAEFITVSFWESREAIEAFADQDIGTAVFYPDDEQFLIERDLTVNHYEVAGTERFIENSIRRNIGRWPHGRNQETC